MVGVGHEATSSSPLRLVVLPRPTVEQQVEFDQIVKVIEII